jgi:hypothetical protein
MTSSHLPAVRKGEDVMSTMTGNMRRAILSGVVGAVLAVGGLGTARADVTSDRAAAIVVYPKIVVDTSGVLFGAPTDTEIQITNTSNSVIAARCFLVNTTSHCSNSPTTACRVETVQQDCPPGGACIASWVERDFKMTLTKRQPILWKVSEGLPTFPCDVITNPPCPGGQSNTGSDGSPSSIPPAPEDPFVGELKCVEVDPGDFKPRPGFDPANQGAGDLKGEATIVSATPDGSVPAPAVDARKYNAIGLESTGVNDGDDILCLGGGVTPACPLGAEYNGCPNVLIMNHFFDDAEVVTHRGNSGSTVTTDLTVVPCTEDFRLQLGNSAVLQFLVFNEFEQRFSTSTSVNCFREVQLSDIDTRPGPFGNAQSIFNVGVQGTLTGQTRIRPVSGSTLGNTVLGVTEEFWSSEFGPGGRFSDAANLHFTGTRDLGDLLILNPEP